MKDYSMKSASPQSIGKFGDRFPHQIKVKRPPRAKNRSIPALVPQLAMTILEMFVVNSLSSEGFSIDDVYVYGVRAYGVDQKLLSMAMGAGPANSGLGLVCSKGRQFNLSYENLVRCVHALDYLDGLDLREMCDQLGTSLDALQARIEALPRVEPEIVAPEYRLPGNQPEVVSAMLVSMESENRVDDLADLLSDES